MAKRARMITGMKDGAMAVEVSQPGFDVLTCAPHQMLFSTSIGAVSALETGEIAIGNNAAVFLPFDYGGTPFITYQVATGSPRRITFPAMFPNFGNVWAVVTDSGATFHNTTGATRVVTYQIWNEEMI